LKIILLLSARNRARRKAKLIGERQELHSALLNFKLGFRKFNPIANFKAPLSNPHSMSLMMQIGKVSKTHADVLGNNPQRCVCVQFPRREKVECFKGAFARIGQFGLNSRLLRANTEPLGNEPSCETLATRPAA